MKIDEIVKQIENNQVGLEKFKDIITKDDFSKFENIKKTFITDANKKLEENRLLKIGIIGQIKRGKSSFLNALLFDGKDILPKGATPMTAALTTIKYSEKPYAKIDFYNKQDWESIKEKAIESKNILEDENFIGELSEENKACLEIYQKASPSILSKLDQQETISNVKRIEDLVDKLENYVGANGEYTPIVKSLELGVNIESIKNIEIVDTPGTNDPVISRGRVTQDFIGQCDVVFFLSLSSQFLDQQDMELLVQNIPNKGVKNIHIVGALFDSAMLDAYNDYKDAGELIENLKHKYTLRAKEDLENILKNSDSDVINSLLNALPPIFISSMCFNIATNYENLNEAEQHTLKNLNEMYNDDFEKDDLLYIANISSIEEKIDIIREKKDEILKEGFKNVVEGTTKQIGELLNKIKKEVKNNFEMLQNNDVEALEKKQSFIQTTMNKSSIKIDNIFKSYIIDIEKKLVLLSQEIKNASKNASNVTIESGTKTENYSEVTNRFTNFFNDSWGRESKPKTINYKYANVHSTIDQLEEFVSKSEMDISKTIDNIIDIQLFKREILQNIIGLFDLSNDSFDPKDIVDTLKNTINRITIPNVDINVSKHIDTIRNGFTKSEILNDEIDKLKNETKRIVGLILEDIRTEISTQTKKIIDELNKAQENFLPVILSDLNKKLDEMKENRMKLEEKTREYEEFFKTINELL